MRNPNNQHITNRHRIEVVRKRRSSLWCSRDSLDSKATIYQDYHYLLEILHKILLMREEDKEGKEETTILEDVDMWKEGIEDRTEEDYQEDYQEDY